MSAPQITVQTTPIGDRYSIGNVGFIRRDGAAGFGDDSFGNMFSGLVERHTDAGEHLLPEKVAGHVWNVMGAYILTATRTAFDQATAETRIVTEAGLRMMEPSMPVDPALAVDVWAAYRAMPPAAQAEAVNAADLTDLTALVAQGNRATLPDPVWELALERYRVENWMDRMNLAAGHPAQATLEHPLATGPDLDAARAESRDLWATHDARIEAAAVNERSAQELLIFLAAVFDITPAAMLDLVMGRADAKTA